MSRPRTHDIPSLGDKFGKYTVIEKPTTTQKILCRCDCGTERKISAYHLRSRPNLSCGCDVGSRISVKKTKHGNSKRGRRTREYAAWAAMINRCYNESVGRYPRYGGRGIIVCERWRSSFEFFLVDMGICPSKDHSIGRINNNGNYEPNNCHWETDEQQANNKTSNVYLEHNGERLSIAQWSRKTGIPQWHISRQKRRGWSDSDILEGRAIGPLK